MKTARLIIQSKCFYTVLICVIILCSWFVGCNNNDNNIGPANEDFFGTYMIRDLTVVQSAGQIDSVYLQIFGNISYDMTFYENVNSADQIDFCNHGGTILDFGTGKVSFAPTLISDNNCDTLSIPRGTFTSDFVNHGDTIWIYRQITNNTAIPPYDSLYILKLLK